MWESQPIPRAELSGTVAQRIQEMIRENDMQAGDQLPGEIRLMEIFGVSRPTVREAIKQLAAENILEVQHGKGTFVRSAFSLREDPLQLGGTDPATLWGNLMETRLLIEPEVSALAAQRATDAHIAELEEILAEMDRLDHRHPDYRACESAFHSAIAKCVQNDVIQRLMPIIHESISEGYHMTVHVVGSYEKAMRSHHRILEAIKAHRPEDARRETELHIRQAIADANKLRKQKEA